MQTQGEARTLISCPAISQREEKRFFFHVQEVTEQGGRTTNLRASSLTAWGAKKGT